MDQPTTSRLSNWFTRSPLVRFLEERRGEVYGVDPDAVEPEALEKVLDVLRRVFGPGRYFETDVQGIEQVPHCPSLLVANHSGGTVFPDVWGLGLAWFEHFGTDRAVHALAHDMVFALEWPGKSLEKLGVSRACRPMAQHLLREGRDLAVWPGGDVETWRPWKDRYTVKWNGRMGYAKLAIQTGVPIVPVACAGAHDTLMVLTDGRRFARAIGLPSLTRAEIFPIHLSLPWGLGIGPLPHLPLPALLRYKFGAPIMPPALEPGAEPSPEMVEALDEKVREAMQGLLDELRDEEPTFRERVEHILNRLAEPLRQTASAA